MEYGRIETTDIDLIAHLWEKQRLHHVERAGVFRGVFEKLDWEKRKRELLDNNKLEIVTAGNGTEINGYCVAAIDGMGMGEIESLYLEPGLRGKGAGAELLRRGLEWLDKEGVKDIKIIVAAGNEEALAFYEKAGFVPRAYVLKRKPG
ncbi:MAG: hypothetical protein A2Y33_01640 [Spirochaetes bacterium GWF1_51_8]|nr:MAG: hypothetical protein A2Y33_01640 [Spirochaetes bacterium GWF1_51_8]